MTVFLMVRLVAKPGKGKVMKELILPHMGDGGALDGCSGLELQVDASDSDRLLIIEKWVSIDAHKKHIKALTESGGMDAVLELSALAPHRTYYSQVE